MFDAYKSLMGAFPNAIWVLRMLPFRVVHFLFGGSWHIGEAQGQHGRFGLWDPSEAGDRSEV